MAASTVQNHCLDIPIDHRLRGLLRPGPPISDPYAGRGKHALTLEQYGKDLKSAGQRISLPEIEFAKTLALPETKGGVLVLLLQPARNQQYDGRDFNTVVQECETLRAVDDVLRVVVGSSLRETSCFDAFPFYKTSIPSRVATGYYEYDEAYQVCINMIHQKQPDVVLCCYRPPNEKFEFFCSLGVGRQHPHNKIRLGDKLGDTYCLPVNAFHPSYAVNYNKGESRFRTLYMLEALKAFHEVNGTWTEHTWMNQLRSSCEDETADLVRENKQNPQIQDFERWERSFQEGLAGLKAHFTLMCSSAFARLSDDGIYQRIIDDDTSRLACDCLLVLNFVVKYSEPGARLPHARHARTVARTVKQSLLDFLSNTLEGPFETVKGERGLVSSAGIDSLSQSLKIPRKLGIQRHLKTNLETLMTSLNDCYPYEVSKVDLSLAEQAFFSFAHQLESVLELHVAATAVPRIDDTAVITQMSSLQLDAKPNDTSTQLRASVLTKSPRLPIVTVTALYSESDEECHVCKQKGHLQNECPNRTPRKQTTVTGTSVSPKANMKCFGCGQAGHFNRECPEKTPQKQSSVTVTPVSRKANMDCYACGETGHFRGECVQSTPRRQTRSTVAASPSSSTSSCYHCKQPGHWKENCPQIQCHRCDKYGHYSRACPEFSSTPRKSRYY